MAQSKEPKKVYDIDKLTTKLKHWKVKVKFNSSLTPTERQKEFRNKNSGSGRRCAYLLEDDSGRIRLYAFDDIAARLESYDIKMGGQEYFIWGAEIRIADKNFPSYGHKYELKFIQSSCIRPVEGELSVKENGAIGGHIAKTTGAGDTKRIKLEFDPITLKEAMETYKSGPHFDVLGIIKKSSVPEPKQHETCHFFVKNMRLIDTTGEVDISVIANKKIELKKLTELKDEVIGLVGCEWREYNKDLISAKLKNLIEEKDLPRSLKAKVQELKEWNEQRSKSPKKGTGKRKSDQCADSKPEVPQAMSQIKKKTTASEISSSLRGATAHSMTTRQAPTHPFSKGKDRQREVLSSDVKAEVSKSVGLILIGGKSKGTGFRVGDKFIVTCLHVIEKAFTAKPHFIDSERMAIEFERKVYNKRENPHQIFQFQPSVAYVDEEHDFVVLELRSHYAGVPLPPPLTCFGEIYASDDIHLVGHPGGRQMMEDSDVAPRWLPDHENEIIPFITELANWSKLYFPMVNGKMIDYYSLLLEPPRKILFHTSFDLGSSGSPGVMIRNEKPCVVLMVAGGTPSYSYESSNPPLLVEDSRKVEFGYAMSDIYWKMLYSTQASVKALASNIFKDFI